jgi:4-hydroxybenzoate polyprenyltransferase
MAHQLETLRGAGKRSMARVTALGRRAAAAAILMARQYSGYARLMRLNRPIGIWLLLWPTLWALWIASDGRPEQHIFLIFVLGVVVMRSAGCVINDYADRRIDPNVNRTRDRPLATGEVKPGEALILFAGLMLIALGLVLTLNRLSQQLAVVGAGLAIIYPFSKRFFVAPQFVLGLAFGWGVPMAFAAELGEVPRLGWLTFMAAIIWATIYDTEYAMVDREDDKKLGVRSTALLFGEADRLILGVLKLMLLANLYLIGQSAGLGYWYLAGLSVAGIFALYQQYLIRDRDPARCFQAFLNNHLLGMAVFIGIALDYLFNPGQLP